MTFLLLYQSIWLQGCTRFVYYWMFIFTMCCLHLPVFLPCVNKCKYFKCCKTDLFQMFLVALPWCSYHVCWLLHDLGGGGQIAQIVKKILNDTPNICTQHSHTKIREKNLEFMCRCQSAWMFLFTPTCNLFVVMSMFISSMGTRSSNFYHNHLLGRIIYVLGCITYMLGHITYLLSHHLYVGSYTCLWGHSVITYFT